MKQDNNEYENALENLNKEFLRVYFSNEYRTGRKLRQIKYYLKKMKIIKLIKKIYISKQKEKNYVKNNFENEKIFKDNSKKWIKDYDPKERVAIYCVNIGGYDHLIQPILKPDKADFFVVSDKKPSNTGVWKWINANDYFQDDMLSNVKKARYLKTHPHILFPRYKYSIFIDGNICCVGDITKFVEKINENTKIGIQPHPFRDCIYDEVVCCARSGKGNRKELYNQAETYKKDGMPSHFGLFETNILVREHNNGICKKIMEDWWTEIKTKTERDQMSLTYVLWKNGLCANDIGVICDSIKNNYLVQVLDHYDESDKV